MTFSIVARDSQTGMLAVAVTTKFFGVGSLCPFARAGVGAVATQALVHPTYGPRGKSQRSANSWPILVSCGSS
jgi:uncharacterized Ntn-hydrolase superfamily protein